MQRVNLYEFYRLCTVLGPLKEVKAEGVTVGAVWVDVYTARESFEAFLGAWKTRLLASRAAANALKDALDALWVVVSPSKPDDFNAEKPLEPWEFFGVRNAINKFETVLAEETGELNSYLVDQKRIFSTQHLVDRAREAFSDDVRNAMPADTLSDFDAAARCLAFDLYTASGFHVVRAMEGVVGAYHDAFTKKKLRAKQRTLGAYRESLTKSKAPGELLGLLTHIKDTYRNVVMHASGWFLTEDEAVSLFHVSQSAITTFVKATIAIK